MDFHGLARRQLQALCKLNKIPANMTNLAMADALSALDSVEGIDEIMQQKSPEKAEGGAAKEPKTVSRTSTRARKPLVKVLESGGTVSKTTTRTTRKLVDDESFEEERNYVGETTALASGRKHAPVDASRRKADAPSVQKVYSTRRSVRLVEKQLSELCLGDSTKRTQPIKIDNELSSEVTESDVKGDSIELGKSERNAEIHEIDEVNSSEVFADHVVQGIKVSSVDMTDATAPEEVEKAMSEACVEEAAGAMGNPEKYSMVLTDGVSNLETGDVVDEGETEKFVKQAPEVSEVAMDLSVVSSDGEFDLATKVDVIMETSVDSEKVEEGVKDVMKVDTEADKHDSNMPAATVEDHSDNLEQTAELGVTGMESGILTAMVGVTAEANDTALPLEEEGNKENTASTLVREECFKALSLRLLKKMVKMEEMKISSTGENVKEGHATKEMFKHQHTPRPRQALRPLLDNSEA